MNHIETVKKLLEEKNFPMDKVELTSEEQNYSILSVDSEKLMVDFRARVKFAKKVSIFVQEDPQFPKIKNECFDFVKLKFER